MKRCVIFDLDGTLADTSGDLIAAANHCFAAMQIEERLDPLGDAGTAVRGGRAMLSLGLGRAGLLSEQTVDKWYPELLAAYDDAIDVHTHMYPGAVQAVEKLLSKGYALGVCTNKPEALAEKLLRSLGVRDLFGSMIGADTLATRKPDVAPYWAAVDHCGGRRDASLLVGDSETDRKTAANAGVPSILVTFAVGGEDVRPLNPESVIDHFDELHPEIMRLIG
ncbi:MAG: HAD-IA family hydrolase [Pelagimonas sp.]|uniref:HAD-IA family hydrolase n=1 Tax=Pelagimonas sp. TaxID=2073170 RepID=UPI003D6C1B88